MADKKKQRAPPSESYKQSVNHFTSSDPRSAHCDLELAVEAIWRMLLESGIPHCDLALHLLKSTVTTLT